VIEAVLENCSFFDVSFEAGLPLSEVFIKMLVANQALLSASWNKMSLLFFQPGLGGR